MEEEIDLRPYIEALIKRWYWIVGTAVMAALVAFGISSLLPPTYEATALVAITSPRYTLQFDSRFQNVNNVQPVYRAYPELAMSDDVLLDLLATNEGFLLENGITLPELRAKLSATAGDDPSLVRLSVTSGEPEIAMMVANAWAELFVARANQLYGSQDQEDVAFFEAQLATAERELETAQQALVAFQARNRTSVLNNELNAAVSAQAAYLDQQQAIALVTQDIQTLRQQLASQSGRQNVTTADHLTALLLQMKAFNVDSASSLQLQLGGAETADNMGLQEQITLLDSLTVELSNKAADVEQHLAALEPRILALQQELQQLKVEQDRLDSNLSIARETHLTLARKLEETRIAAQEAGGEVQLASKAALPQKPISSGRLRNTLVAFMAGLFLSSFVVLGAKWWRETNDMLPPSVEVRKQEAQVSAD